MARKYKEMRLAPLPEKEQAYEEIHKLYRAGSSVTVKEHASGFPAVTVDCCDIHILTDCLSLEEWWAKVKREARDGRL